MRALALVASVLLLPACLLGEDQFECLQHGDCEPGDFCIRGICTPDPDPAPPLEPDAEPDAEPEPEPEPAGPIAQMSAGDDHTCVVVREGPLVCWGHAANGRLGDDYVVTVQPPVEVDLPQIVQVVAGNDHTCARDATGWVYCWGANLFHQVSPEAVEEVTTPTLVALPALATDISTTSHATCALLADSSVWCWGMALNGQLADPTGWVLQAEPARVLGLDAPVERIHVGGYAACAVHAGGETVSCWGANNEGQLGNAEIGDSRAAVPVYMTRPLSQLDLGMRHACARDEDDAVLCWGHNGLGVAGFPETTYRVPIPTPAATLSDRGARHVEAGFHNSCAILDEGSVGCWGLNSSGILGLEPTGEENDGWYGLQVISGIGAATQLTLGYSHACAWDADDEALECWGANNLGQLGAPAAAISVVPVSVDLSEWLAR